MPTFGDFEIDTINIMMYNNIDREKPVELTAKMFIFDQPVKGDYMWLCTNIRYSEEVLISKTHAECVELFFDKDKFISYLKQSRLKKTTNNDPNELRKIESIKWRDSEADNNYDDGYDAKVCKITHKNLCFMKDNMLIALKYCFRITFPVDNPPHSFSANNVDGLTVSKLLNSWFNSDKYANFTHMTVFDKKSTLIGCKWLDNAKYHPVYQKVFRNINNYLKKVKEPLLILIDSALKKGIFKELDTNNQNNNQNNNNAEYAKEKNKNPGFTIENEFKNFHNFIMQNSISSRHLFHISYLMYYFYITLRIDAIKNKDDKNKDDKNNLTKPIKELELITMLTHVFSTQGYRAFITKSGLSQVDLQKYDFYKPYIDSFSTLTFPNRESKNIYIVPLFQEKEDDYISGTYSIYQPSYGYYDYISDPNSPYIGIDRINLSADKKKLPQYEIYVAMEFVGGLVTDSNKKAVGCLFENNRLGNLLKKIISKEESTELLPMIEYIDLSKLIESTEKTQKLKEKESKKTSVDKETSANDNKKLVSDDNKNPAANDNIKPASDNSIKPASDDLLKLEIDKLSGVTPDFQKEIISKINTKAKYVKDLADIIQKSNNDNSLNSEYMKAVTIAETTIGATIQNNEQDATDPKSSVEKIQKAERNRVIYNYIKELIENLKKQAQYAKKPGGNRTKTRRCQKNKRNRKTHRNRRRP